jgi:hypothetical protein
MTTLNHPIDPLVDYAFKRLFANPGRGRGLRPHGTIVLVQPSRFRAHAIRGSSCMGRDRSDLRLFTRVRPGVHRSSNSRGGR